MMATTYKCYKCGKENVIDLYDNTVWVMNKFINQPTIYYENVCSCKKKAKLTLDLEWGETKHGIDLKKWSICKINYTDEDKERQGLRDNKHGSDSRGKFPKPIDPHKIGDWKDIVDRQHPDGLNDERILAAIWLGLTRLQLPQNERRKIMEIIEQKLDELDELDELD